MKKRLTYKGVDLYLDVDSFDSTKPLVVINRPNDDSLLINVVGMLPEWVEKKPIMNKMFSLAQPYGRLMWIVSHIGNRSEPTSRELVVNGITFAEVMFDTKEGLMSAYIPKSATLTPTINRPSPVAWAIDPKHPTLEGRMLGRQFMFAKTNDDYRFIYGPRVA
jgi:hypothetical protein